MIKIDWEKFYVPNTKSQVSIFPFYKLSKTGHPKQELTFYEHQCQLPYLCTCLAYNLPNLKKRLELFSQMVPQGQKMHAPQFSRIFLGLRSVWF